MKVVRPIPITNSELAVSSIPEPDTSRGEVEFVPDRRSVNFYDKNPAQPNSNFRNAAYVSGHGYYVLTNVDIELYDEDFNFVTSRGVDSGLGSRERIFSSYDPETGLSSGVYVLYRDSGNTFYTLASYEYDLSSYTGTVTINPDAGNLNAKEFCGSIAGGRDTFTFAIRDQLPSPPNTPMTFYEFEYEFNTNGAVKVVVGQQSIWDYVYRYDLAYTDKGVALMGFTDDAPGQDFITDIFFLSSDYIVNERITLSLKTQFRSSVFVWNGTDFQCWCASTAFGVPSGDFVVESYDPQGVTRGVYLPGDRVIKTNVHKVYQCAVKTSEDPEQGVINVPQTWVEVGATNRWAMFDYKRTTKSVDGSSLDLEIDFISTVDAVSVFNFSGVDTIRVIATSETSGEVYNTLHDTDGLTELVDLDIPPFDDLTISIQFTGANITVGEVVVGLSRELGVLVAGVVSDRIDYSRLVYDDFGEVEYVERPIVKYITYPIAVPKKDALSIERYLDELKGTQSVWVGDSGGDDLITTFGRIERSPMTYNNQAIVEYQIKVRGSI